MAFIIIVGGWYLYYIYFIAGVPQGAGEQATSTMPTAPGPAVFDQTLSDGTITLKYPSALFGLATTKEQIAKSAYIPACAEGFDYCLYYIGSEYSGTNFESAGLAIQKRDDLKTQAACLATSPEGYSNLRPQRASSSLYATSIFSPVGDAAAGHSATGSVYRLSYQGNCYEFTTRVGQTQFENYASGTVQKFTLGDQADIELALQRILSTLTFPSGESASFFQSS